MWLINLKRKIQELLGLITQISPYRAELTVQGTEAALIGDIFTWLSSLAVYTTRQLKSVTNSTTFVCTGTYTAIPPNAGITHVTIEGSETMDGTYSVSSIVCTQSTGFPPYTYDVTVVTNLEFPLGSTVGTIVFQTPVFVPATLAPTGLSNGAIVSLSGSLHNDGMYTFIEEHDEEGLNVISFDETAIFDDSAQPGSIYSLPLPADLVVQHKLNAKFVRLSATLNNGVDAESILIQSSETYEADPNELTISKDAWGLQIGYKLKVVVEKMFDNVAEEEEVLAPGGLPDDPIIPKG